MESTRKFHLVGRVWGEELLRCQNAQLILWFFWDMGVREDENGKLGRNFVVKLVNVVMGRSEIILGKRVHSRILA